MSGGNQSQSQPEGAAGVAEPAGDEDNCVEIWWLEELRLRYAAVHGYLGFAVCLFGVLTNMANIVVLTRRHMVSSTNLLLCALAVANVVKMLSFIPVYAHFYLDHSEELLFHTRSSVWLYYLLVQISLGIASHAVALYITISIAIFRYLYIRYPIAGAQFCSIRNTVIVIVSVTALSVLISVPNIVSNDMDTVDIHRPNTTGARPSNGSGDPDPEGHEHVLVRTVYKIGLSKSWPFMQTLNMWVQSVFIRFIPCIMLTVFTLLLLIEMRKAKMRRCALKGSSGPLLGGFKQHKKASPHTSSNSNSNSNSHSHSNSQSSRKEKENDRTTAMLLAVVALFLANEFPQGVMTLINSISDCFFSTVYMAFGDLLDLFTLTNSSVSFIIYTTMSRQFRQSFVRIFWSRCASASASRWSSNYTSRKTSYTDAVCFTNRLAKEAADLPSSPVPKAYERRLLLNESRINSSSNKPPDSNDSEAALVDRV